MNATVDIVDVVKGAEVVPVESVTVGDTVFDIYGGEYKVTKVRELKREIKATRDDGWVSWLDRGETITIKRGTDHV